MTFCCGFFPAFGAALAGIINQGEFRRIAQRSQSMSDQLQLQYKQIEALRHHLTASTDSLPQLSAHIAHVAGDTAGMMVNEVLDSMR